MIIKLKVALKAGKELFRPGYYSNEGKGFYALVNENGNEIPETLLNEITTGRDTVEVISNKIVKKEFAKTSEPVVISSSESEKAEAKAEVEAEVEAKAEVEAEVEAKAEVKAKKKKKFGKKLLKK